MCNKVLLCSWETWILSNKLIKTVCTFENKILEKLLAEYMKTTHDFKEQRTRGRCKDQYIIVMSWNRRIRSLGHVPHRENTNLASKQWTGHPEEENRLADPDSAGKTKWIMISVLKDDVTVTQRIEIYGRCIEWGQKQFLFWSTLNWLILI